VLFTFSANNFSYATWFNIVSPYAWLPLYLAGLLGILMNPKCRRYFFMALCGIVLSILASPSQSMIHAVFLTIIFAWIFYIRKVHSFKNRQFISVIAVGGLAFLLVAPALVPAIFELKNMIRWIGPFPAVIGNARIPFNAFQIDQLNIIDLGGVFFKIKGPDVGNQFSGILVIALALVAVATRYRSWIVFALAFIALYSIISSAGSNLGFAYLNYIIPAINKIREPSRFLILFQLAISILAALGIDELCKKVLRADVCINSRRQFIALWITFIIAIFILIVLRDRIVSLIPPITSLTVLFSLSLMTWLAMRSNFSVRRIIIGVMWSSSAIAMLAVEVPWIPPSISSGVYLSGDTLSLDVVIKHIVKLDPARDYRVIFDGKIDKQNAAMLASYRGVRSFNSYFNPAPRRQFEEIYYQGPRADNYYRTLGAKYLICKECTEDSLKGYTYLENISGYEIYETNDVLPHSYIVQNLNGNFLNLSDFVAKANNMDLTKKILYVEQNTVFGFNINSHQVINDCINRESFRGVNHSSFMIQCKSPGVFVMNEFFDESWSASVDGVKVQPIRVNGSQIGVPFAAGSHVVEFRYFPTIFLVSLGLMFIGILVLVLLIWSRLFKSDV
jgi:hypothetical protein